MSKGMSKEMFDFIKDNTGNLNIDLESGIIITPRGTNGTICKSTGYLRVKINGKSLQVHQILSVYYYGDKCINMQINHIDGNKLNNKKENLEVVTQLENIKHAFDNGLASTGHKNNQEIKVDMLTLDGDFIKSFKSIGEASKYVGLKTTTSIRACLKGYMINGRGERREALTAGGYKWRHSIT